MPDLLLRLEFPLQNYLSGGGSTRIWRARRAGTGLRLLPPGQIP